MDPMNLDRTRQIRRLGGLTCVVALALALAPAAMAVPPEYSIAVSKTADPLVVPAGGGTVTYTVTVENAGTGFLQVVNLEDSDCTLTGPTYTTGDDDDKLEAGEVWTYTCSVDDVTPPHTNTVTVNACHDGSPDGCNNESHNASAENGVTVTEATAEPTAGPSGGAPTLPPTDTSTVSDRGTDGFAVALAALAGLLGVALVVTPRRARNR
jgi:hypothetical protein